MSSVAAMQVFSLTTVLRTALLPFLLLLPAALYGGEKFDAAAIPDTLLPANAVIREHSVRFTVEDVRQSNLKVRYVVTIFSKTEQEKGQLILRYDAFSSIEDITGILYDAEGKEIRELDEDEIHDQSALSESNLHDEYRIRYAIMTHNVYPYTVEFNYEIAYESSLSWPEWHDRRDENPVERSEFIVTVPQEYGLRYWCNQDSVRPMIERKGSKVTYSWSRSLLPPLSKEALDGDMYDVQRIVTIAPNDFQVAKVRGSMKSWEEFGKWYYTLKRDKLKIPEDAMRDVAAIKASEKNERELIKKLYEYMQKRTRYVSVQLGIGGWQPYDATYVHTRGYGDCKALVNYMEALLSHAGIESSPVLINSGDDRLPMNVDFPSQQFNHVILSVPAGKDTVWLECTNQFMPFGKLSVSTRNRPALQISPAGGTVVRTPQNTAEENRQDRRVTVGLSHLGAADIRVTTEMAGQRQMTAQSRILNSTPKEQTDWILSQMEMGNITLSDVRFTGVEDRSPVIGVDFSAVVPRYGSLNGNRIFFHPSIIARRTYIPPVIENRISPYRFDYPYLNTDSITITLPKGYAVETLPAETSVSRPFGSFFGKTVNQGDSVIVYVRKTEIRSDEIPASQYSDYRSFVAEIVKADRAQVVLKKR